MRGIGTAQIFLRIAMISGFTLCSAARAVTLVDCTGVNTSAYKTISAALAATPAMGAGIQVIAGPCNESVTITGRYNLNLGAQPGKTIVLNGMIDIENSASVYIYGFNVTNVSGNGIAVNVSRGVTLDTVNGDGNKKHGLVLFSFSDVTLFGPSTFQNNGGYGIKVQEQSAMDIETSAGALNVSNNSAGGFFIYDGAGVAIAGNTTVENNGNGPIGHQAGFAVHDTSTLQLNDCTGNNLIQGNVNSGIEVQGGSTTAVAACGTGFQNLIQNNGGYGVQVLLSSEMVVNGEAQISGSPQAGVFVDGGASLFLNGNSLITNNGTAGDIETGGVLIGNGSALEAHHAQVNSNYGWAFVGFLGGNLNVYGTTATGNEFGIVGCDSSAYLDTDLPHTPAIHCAVPVIPSLAPSPVRPLSGIHPLKPRAFTPSETDPPDPAAMAEKVRQARTAFWETMQGGMRPKLPIT
jgi:Right handed beta helix region